MPWLVAGGAVLALLIALLAPRLGTEEPQPVAAPPLTGPALGDPSGVDIGSMSPLEAATRLFNRVVGAAEAGDTAQARAFAPMAIAAYERVEPLDLDSRFHMGWVHLINGDAAAARQQADAILTEVPTHLYGLIVGARAARLAGDPAAARDFYARFIENYDAEIASGRVEYSEHGNILPVMREEAAAEVQ